MIFDYKRNFRLILLVFFSIVVTFSFTANIVYGAGVTEGCDMFELRSDCDLSGWMHLVLDSAQAGALALFLHFLSHRQSKKLEIIITNQEKKRINKEKFANETLKNHFTVLLFNISILKQIVNKYNEKSEKDENLVEQIKDEQHRLENISLNIQYTSLTSSDVILPEALTEIQQIQRLIQNPIKSKNHQFVFEKYDEIKKKVTHASQILK